MNYRYVAVSLHFYATLITLGTREDYIVSLINFLMKMTSTYD